MYIHETITAIKLADVVIQPQNVLGHALNFELCWLRITAQECRDQTLPQGYLGS